MFSIIYIGIAGDAFFSSKIVIFAQNSQTANNMANDWKSRLGMVYSTDPNFQYVTDEEPEAETLEPSKQVLRVWRDSKQRGGKVVTIVRGFVGTEDDLRELGRMLKTKCGVGGSVKDGEIIIQGDHRDRTVEILTKAGYGCKKAGG